MIHSQRSADFILFIIALAWGTSYLLTDIVLREISPFWQTGLRFLIGFIVIALLSRDKLKNPSPATKKWSLILGTLLVGIYLGATFAIKYTSLTNAAFLSCITVAFIPIFSIFYGKKVPLKTWILVAFTTLGVGLLTLNDNFSFQLGHIKGDLFALFCSASYANHLILTEKAVSDAQVNPFQVGCFQLFVCSLINFALALLFEDFSLPSQPITYMSLVFLAIACTGLPFLIQPLALSYTTPAHTAIIYTLEPLVAAFLAWGIAGEVMSGQSLMGATILIASILYMELGTARKEKNEKA
ncbi:MAG: DMT family transporter [Tissierellia bacterium]|nr:DMT family transporter [Tissierellia bacterium]